MKTDIYLKLQKKFGGKWVATSRSGRLVYAQAKRVDQLFKNLKKKNIPPKKAVIGFIEKYGQVSAYFSLWDWQTSCLCFTRKDYFKYRE